VAANPQGDFRFEMESRCRSGSDIPWWVDRITPAAIDSFAENL